MSQLMAYCRRSQLPLVGKPACPKPFILSCPVFGQVNLNAIALPCVIAMLEYAFAFQPVPPDVLETVPGDAVKCVDFASIVTAPLTRVG